MKAFCSSSGLKQLESGRFFQNSADRYWSSVQIASNHPGGVLDNINLIRERMAAVIEDDGMGQCLGCSYANERSCIEVFELNVVPASFQIVPKEMKRILSNGFHLGEHFQCEELLLSRYSGD